MAEVLEAGGTLTFDHKAAGKVWKAALSSRSSAEDKAAPLSLWD